MYRLNKRGGQEDNRIGSDECNQENNLSIEARNLVDNARIPYKAAMAKLKEGNLEEYFILMKKHRELYKEFLKEHAKEKKKIKLENIVERECNTMTECWELYRRLARGKKKEESTFKDEEKQEVQTWWEETYGGDEESILEQRKTCCPIGLEEVSQCRVWGTEKLQGRMESK